MNDIKKIIWIAKELFKRNKVSGSSGNISFRSDKYIYVSNSGSCFGMPDKNSFARFDLNGKLLAGTPSKEYPMHLKLYGNKNINCIIHTHSHYSTLLSCIDRIEDNIDKLFKYTPYLKMQTVGFIKVVDYAKPGSNDLFNNFYNQYDVDTKVYLLKNHGVFVSGNDMLKTFYLLEEFEETSRLFIDINKDNKYKTIG